MDIMRPHMRGWMGVLLLRRAALVFCLLLGQRGGGIVHVPYFGNEIGWLGPPFFILLICVGAQGYCQPFATANDNVLEMFGLLTLLTFVFSDTFFVGKRPPPFRLPVCSPRNECPLCVRRAVVPERNPDETAGFNALGLALSDPFLRRAD